MSGAAPGAADPRSPRFALCSGLLVCLMAASCLWTQYLCIGFLSIRLVLLDVAAAAACVLALRNGPLLALLAVLCLANIACVSYAHVFNGPPSLAVLVNGAHLARPLLGDLAAYVPPFALWWLLIFALQCALLRLRPRAARPRRAVLLSAGLVLLLLADSFRVMPAAEFTPETLSRRQTEAAVFATPTRTSVPVHGILSTVLLEWLTDYPRTARHTRPPMSEAGPAAGLPEITLPRRLALIQVESLDYELLFQKYDNRYVMPFLHSLVADSYLFRLDGTKKLSSANSDYELFTGRVASPHMTHYETETDYSGSLLGLLRERFPSVVAIHGMPEAYMNRGQAMRLQGVRDYYSLERLKKEGVPALPVWYSGCIRDRDAFAFAASLIPPGPFVQFIFSIDMHMADAISAYTADPAAAADRTRAFYTLCLTDDAIRAYVDALPDKTGVIIWGDHSSYWIRNSGAIPLLIFIKGESHPHDGSPVSGLTRSAMHHYLKRLFLHSYS